jgi:surfactin synthase thioesterase subunit
MLTGDHFFIHTCRDTVITLVAYDLARAVHQG